MLWFLFIILEPPNWLTYNPIRKNWPTWCAGVISMYVGWSVNWWLCCRTDGAEDQYSVLINFDTQNSTDNFYKHFNGKQFSSLEVLVVLTLLNLALCLFLLMLWLNFTMAIDWRLIWCRGMFAMSVLWKMCTTLNWLSMHIAQLRAWLSNLHVQYVLVCLVVLNNSIHLSKEN
jgi:hypothetical protein